MTARGPCYTSRPVDVLDVAARLAGHYGPTPWREHGAPLDELIATMLSQHTSDTNTARAFKSLKASFDTWDAMRTAPVSDVEDAIRPGGLAAVKAPRIHNILHEIHSSQTTLDLEQLRSMSLEDARGWLLGLHGVGPKTAACVLLFSLGKPALPVDTHVHRASRRLGIIGPKVSANAAHGALEVALGDDRDRVYAFHMNAITHGRTICKARTPLCDQCFLRDRCPYVDQCVHNA